MELLTTALGLSLALGVVGLEDHACWFDGTGGAEIFSLRPEFNLIREMRPSVRLSQRFVPDIPLGNHATSRLGAHYAVSNLFVAAPRNLDLRRCSKPFKAIRPKDHVRQLQNDTVNFGNSVPGVAHFPRPKQRVLLDRHAHLFDFDVRSLALEKRFSALFRFVRLSHSLLGGRARLLERAPDQVNANRAERYTYDSHPAHYRRPDRNSALAVKIVFFALLFAGGAIYFARALLRGSADRFDTFDRDIILGVFGVVGGVAGGLVIQLSLM